MIFAGNKTFSDLNCFFCSEVIDGNDVGISMYIFFESDEERSYEGW